MFSACLSYCRDPAAVDAEEVQNSTDFNPQFEEPGEKCRFCCDLNDGHAGVTLFARMRIATPQRMMRPAAEVSLVRNGYEQFTSFAGFSWISH